MREAEVSIAATASAGAFPNSYGSVWPGSPRFDSVNMSSSAVEGLSLKLQPSSNSDMQRCRTRTDHTYWLVIDDHSGTRTHRVKLLLSFIWIYCWHTIVPLQRQETHTHTHSQSRVWCHRGVESTWSGGWSLRQTGRADTSLCKQSRPEISLLPLFCVCVCVLLRGQCW